MGSCGTFMLWRLESIALNYLQPLISTCQLWPRGCQLVCRAHHQIWEYWQKCCCLKKWSSWSRTNHTGGYGPGYSLMYMLPVEGVCDRDQNGIKQSTLRSWSRDQDELRVTNINWSMHFLRYWGGMALFYPCKRSFWKGTIKWSRMIFTDLGWFSLIKILDPGHKHFYGQYISGPLCIIIYCVSILSLHMESTDPMITDRKENLSTLRK